MKTVIQNNILQNVFFSNDPLVSLEEVPLLVAGHHFRTTGTCEQCRSSNYPPTPKKLSTHKWTIILVLLAQPGQKPEEFQVADLFFEEFQSPPIIGR